MKILMRLYLCVLFFIVLIIMWFQLFYYLFRWIFTGKEFGEFTLEWFIDYQDRF